MSVTAAAQGLDPPGPPAPTPGPALMVQLTQETAPGDSESLFIISDPGSYILTRDITMFRFFPVRHGVVIEADDVTLDLGGHALDGLESFAVPFGLPTPRTGVLVSGEISHVTLRNGTFQDWGQSGVNLEGALSCEIESVTVTDSDFIGIRLGDSARVRDCTVRRNGASGLRAFDTAQITRVTAEGNGNSGIAVGADSAVVDCISHANGTAGFSISSNSVVRHCVATDNASLGISAGVGSTVRDCVSFGNGLHGIRVSSNAQVLDCVARDNGADPQTEGAGIDLTVGRNFVRGNVANFNDVGIAYQTGDNNVVTGNTAMGNTVDEFSPNTSGNQIGPIGNAATATSPWANFTD